MSEKSCPVPTPEEQRYIEITEKAERKVLDQVFAAIDATAKQVAYEFQKAGLGLEPTSVDYFKASVHQALFVSLSGGNPETLLGGDPEVGQRIVDNGQNIIDHYWRRSARLESD